MCENAFLWWQARWLQCKSQVHIAYFQSAFLKYFYNIYIYNSFTKFLPLFFVTGLSTCAGPLCPFLPICHQTKLLLQVLQFVYLSYSQSSFLNYGWCLVEISLPTDWSHFTPMKLLLSFHPSFIFLIWNAGGMRPSLLTINQMVYQLWRCRDCQLSYS